MLVVAAVRAELADLNGETLGVGPVRAAAAMATLLAKRTPQAVVLVGSAGAYHDRPQVGEPIVAHPMGFSSPGAEAGLGYVPLAPEPIPGDPRLLERLDLPRRAVLTTPAITTDPALAARLGRLWAVEHMETWGAAWACQQAGVPFVAVLGIANRVGPDAHAEWVANRARAEAAARDAIRPLLERR